MLDVYLSYVCIFLPSIIIQVQLLRLYNLLMIILTKT